MLSHSNSFGNNAEKDTAGGRASYRKSYCNRSVLHSMKDGSLSVPTWEKSNLTLAEAAEYFNIGINKLREITNERECEHCVLYIGNRRLIKRKKFEEYLSGVYSI